jgi:hypothetical protein
VTLSEPFRQHFVGFTPYFPHTQRLISPAIKLFNLLIHLTPTNGAVKGVASHAEGVYATGQRGFIK